jgi:hypothetical protein
LPVRKKLIKAQKYKDKQISLAKTDFLVLENSVGYKNVIIPFSQKYRKALRPTHPPMKWAQASFPVAKWPGREFNY